MGLRSEGGIVRRCMGRFGIAGAEVFTHRLLDRRPVVFPELVAQQLDDLEHGPRLRGRPVRRQVDAVWLVRGHDGLRLRRSARCVARACASLRR